MAAILVYLTIDTFRDVAVRQTFPSPSHGWYLLHVVSGNRYLPTGSSQNSLHVLILPLAMYLLI